MLSVRETPKQPRRTKDAEKTTQKAEENIANTRQFHYK